MSKSRNADALRAAKRSGDEHALALARSRAGLCPNDQCGVEPQERGCLCRYCASDVRACQVDASALHSVYGFDACPGCALLLAYHPCQVHGHAWENCPGNAFMGAPDDIQDCLRCGMRRYRSRLTGKRINVWPSTGDLCSDDGNVLTINGDQDAELVESMGLEEPAPPEPQTFGVGMKERHIGGGDPNGVLDTRAFPAHPYGSQLPEPPLREPRPGGDPSLWPPHMRPGYDRRPNRGWWGNA